MINMNETMLGTKMQDSIAQRVQVDDWSLSLPLRCLLSFYTMLVIVWCIALCIGIGFQYKYHLDNKKQKREQGEKEAAAAVIHAISSPDILHIPKHQY